MKVKEFAVCEEQDTVGEASFILSEGASSIVMFIVLNDTVAEIVSTKLVDLPDHLSELLDMLTVPVFAVIPDE